MLLTVDLELYEATYETEWEVVGPTELSAQDKRIALLGATTVTAEPVDLSEKPGTNQTGTRIQATLDTGPLSVGTWQVFLHMTRVGEEFEGDDPPEEIKGASDPIEVTPRPFAAGDDVGVTLKRAAVPPTPDQALWVAIRKSTTAIGFDNYNRFLEAVICGQPGDGDRFPRRRVRHKLRSVKRRTGLPFPHVDRYRVLKAATEVFLMIHTGVDLDDFRGVDLEDESRRLNRTVDRGDLETEMQQYLEQVLSGEGDVLDVLPYLGLIRRQLGDVAIVGVGEDDDEATEICSGLLAEKLEHPCFLELFDSYWRDEAGLVTGMNAIGWRFQNRTPRGRGRDPLLGLDVDPLRPLNNLLWGWCRTSSTGSPPCAARTSTTTTTGWRCPPSPGRRCAGPTPGRGSWRRSTTCWHGPRCSSSYDDDTTHIADGFPVLNALKETHLLLTEGAHNQYGDLPWTARHEMLMYEWILSRPEVNDFLPTRKMVAYAEPWIGPLEALNKLLGGPDVSVMHFRDLAVFGEQLLLSIRYGAWSRENDQALAANWVRYWRPELQGYIHAYRAVTGVDLTRRPSYHHPRQAARAGAYR